MNLELSPLFLHNPLFIVSTYFEFQACMFSNGRDMTKCQFLHHDDNNDDAMAIAIPRVFSVKSQAKKLECILYHINKKCKLSSINGYFSSL